MKLLFIDILRTALDEVWPSVEHSLGLMYLSSSLKKALGSGVDIRIRTLISKPNQPDAERSMVRLMLEEWGPQTVGLRCLTIGKDSLGVVARAVKDWRNDCFVVVGGPYATDDPGGVLRTGDVDCVVIGEGELTATELVQRLLSHSPYYDVAGIAYTVNGEIIRTPPRPPILDLDALPFPDYSLVDLDAFSNRYLTFSSKIYQPHANLLTT
ncbi:MAG TPA: cobalamin-dependent protein, partial [Spirochaetia bacterium]|nr:cobalamin-dependent protein [Spirochaetia bacterium]